jgi:hypothetical protein
MPHKKTLYVQLWRGFLPEAQFIPLDMIPDFLADTVNGHFGKKFPMLLSQGPAQK